MKAEKTGGCLYLIGTPIGNLEDITLRALRLMREVDLLAAEDTRELRKLLTHFEIQKPFVSYHKFSEKKNAAGLVERMLGGEKIGLVSDAGMPCISDPGRELVRQCVEAGVRVEPVPGPCSVETALCATGFDLRQYAFLGFLPKKPSKRRKALAPFAADNKTLVIFESPYRIYSLLEDVVRTLGDRRVALARELTKLYEEFIRGSAQELLDARRPLKGEMVLVVEGAADGGPEEDDGEEDDPERKDC